MRRLLLLLVASLVLAPGLPAARGQAPARVEYRLTMPDPASHVFEVTVSAPVESGAPVEFQMPAWSPGRYVIYDFARNVQEVTAVDEAGRPLSVAKTDKQTWRVEPGQGARVVLSYGVFADNLSGTFSQLDARHANFNGASVFMYVVGRKPAPTLLTVEPPPGWRVWNALTTSRDQTVFETANYDLLIDTPTEIAPELDVRTFEVDGREYRVVVHQLEGHASIDKYAKDVERIVRTENKVIGPPPDMPRYTFLVHCAPGVDSGDGMEHLASTQIVHTFSLGDESRYGDLLSVTAHEFFHQWNIKRIRPVELGPWDFTRENYTTSLWIGEGITSYYGDLSLERAGLLSDEKYFDALADEIGELQARPGRLLMSAERSSFDTWLYLAVRPRQRTNANASTIDYYNKGELLGLLLDLEIRHRTNGARSLDDVFRLMWKRFFLDAPAETYYYKGRGYRGSDFLAAVNEVSGSDFTVFFAKYVEGTEELDYDTTLAHAGLRLERERRVAATGYGVRLESRFGRLRVTSLEQDGLAASGGLREGDTVLRIGDRNASETVVRDLFERGSVTPVSVRIERDGKQRDLTIPAVPATMRFEVEERGDATDAQRALRRAWLWRQ
jgi:predicted metalloprotease with PDZ domain